MLDQNNLESKLKRMDTLTTLPKKERSTDLEIKDLGKMEYSESLTIQETLRLQRINEQIPNMVLMVEHFPVYTLGKDLVDKSKLIKYPLLAPIFNVNRGGKITFHGPGQLVCYFIFKIPLPAIGRFVDAIEELTLSLANEQGIAAYSRQNEVDIYGKNIRGAWYRLEGEHKKIAAQGIETKSAGSDAQGNKYIVTMHGFAFNVSTDLNYFTPINACGFRYDVMTSVEEVLGQGKVSFDKMKEQCQAKIPHFFNSFS